MARTDRRRLGIRLQLTLTYTALLVATTVAVFVALLIVLAVTPGYAWQYGPYPSGYFTVITVSGKRDVLALFTLAAIAATLVIGVVGGALSWFIAGRILRPLNDVIDLAQSVDNRTLHRRVGLSGTQDEIGRLGGTVDRMLERLEIAFASSARFAGNASHELRTPLAASRTILQVAVQSEHGPDADQALARLAELNDQMIAITTSLLDLATADQAEIADEVDLAELVDAAVEALRIEIETAAVRLERRVTSAPVLANEALLARLVVNLVRNAVVHNRAGGWILVDLRVHGGRAHLTVANSGDVLTTEQVATLAEPFSRARQRVVGSRRRTEGHGLGLPLVSAIAEVHGADLVLTAGDPDGLRIDLEMALAPSR